MTDLYTGGGYLANQPTWHEEDSAWKAGRIVELLRRNRVSPASVVDVGCGSGAVIDELAKTLGGSVTFTGYDISPQAHAIASRRARENVRFVQGDLLATETQPCDVVMAIDVLEHVEDCFAFARKLREKGTYKVLHIPLDLSAQSVLRGSPLMEVRRGVGHIHYFTKDLALSMLRECGYEIVDWFYTNGALDLPAKSLRGRLAKLPRRIAATLNRDVAARLLGGFSVLVLAK